VNATRGRRIQLLAHALAVVALVSEVLYLAVAIPRTDDLLMFSPAFVLFTASTLVVGWILAWKRPRNPLGWIVLGIALLTTAGGPTAAIGVATLHSNRALAEWMLWYGGPSQWSWIPVLGPLLTQLPLRFPDGRLPSPRWRWFSWWTIAGVVGACFVFATVSPTLLPDLRNPAYLPMWGSVSDAIPLLFAILLLGTSSVGSIASLFVRYRRADAVQRAQLRWIFWAFAIVVSGLVLSWIAGLLIDSGSELGRAVSDIEDVSSGFLDSLIPLAILFAVLRTGLYSIDRIISRTAAYGIVTVATLAVYGGGLLLVSVVSSGLSSPGTAGLPPIGVALATLAAAAVFLPLLRLVRRVVDRRFNREQYDAETVVERFGRRIRDGADPHTAGADLVGAVGQTLQPSAIGLWTRETPR
jgi:hypothetical protein